MNRAQVGVVVVALLGVVALSGVAPTIHTTVGDAGSQNHVETVPLPKMNGTPTQVQQKPHEAASGGGPPPKQAGGDSGDSASDIPTDILSVPLPLLGIVAVVLVVAALLGIRSLRQRDHSEETTPEALSDEEETEDDEPDEQPDEETDTAIEDLGRSAGRAADHLADTQSPSNAVHRAWYEMTRHLDVPHPHASTPEEFADAAVAAGMDRTDVADLTEQFELVRYAGHEPTPERVLTAETALRRIEDKYTENA